MRGRLNWRLRNPRTGASWRFSALKTKSRCWTSVWLRDLKAVELAPRDARALDALGWAYAQAGYLVKAEGALKQALDSAPQYGPAHLHLGITYLRWGQNDLARDQLTEAQRV